MKSGRSLCAIRTPVLLLLSMYQLARHCLPVYLSEWLVLNVGSSWFHHPVFLCTVCHARVCLTVCRCLAWPGVRMCRNRLMGISPFRL